MIKPDFTPAADHIAYAPPESLTDLPVSVRPNRAKKKVPGEEWMTDQEHIVVLSMNLTNEVAAIYEAAKGPPDHAAVIAIDILKVPILTGCRAFIVIHNHPGGSPFPSDTDKHFTKKVASSAECIGLTLLDHVIIGRHGHFSFVERDLL